MMEVNFTGVAAWPNLPEEAEINWWWVIPFISVTIFAAFYGLSLAVSYLLVAGDPLYK